MIIYLNLIPSDGRDQLDEWIGLRERRNREGRGREREEEGAREREQGMLRASEQNDIIDLGALSLVVEEAIVEIVIHH